MAAVRVRLLGGALNGQVMWVEKDQTVLSVHMAKGVGNRNTLQYKIEGSTGTFLSESGTGTDYVTPADRKKAAQQK